MEFTAKQIAHLLEGEVEGNENAVVNRLSKIEEAKDKSLTFLANPKYTEYIYSTEASVVIVNKSFKPEKKLPPCTLVKVPDAYKSFAVLLEHYNHLVSNKEGEENPVYKGKNLSLGQKIYLGAFSYLGDN
ncbi:MAG: LpxD N-terminal domain-containing protein, partial [Luteibaculum sp.]